MSTIPGDKPPVPTTIPKPPSKAENRPLQGESKDKFEFVKPIETKPEIPLAI